MFKVNIITEISKCTKLFHKYIIVQTIYIHVLQIVILCNSAMTVLNSCDIKQWLNQSEMFKINVIMNITMTRPFYKKTLYTMHCNIIIFSFRNFSSLILTSILIFVIYVKCYKFKFFKFDKIKSYTLQIFYLPSELKVNATLYY